MCPLLLDGLWLLPCLSMAAAKWLLSDRVAKDTGVECISKFTLLNIWMCIYIVYICMYIN